MKTKIIIQILSVTIIAYIMMFLLGMWVWLNTCEGSFEQDMYVANHLQQIDAVQDAYNQNHSKRIRMNLLRKRQKLINELREYSKV